MLYVVMTHARVCFESRIHQRLCVGRFVAYVVSETATTDEIENEIMFLNEMLVAEAKKALEMPGAERVEDNPYHKALRDEVFEWNGEFFKIPKMSIR